MLGRMNPGAEAYNELLLFRRVTGADEFLAQAIHAGDTIFGDEQVGVVPVPRYQTEQNFDVAELVTVGLPRAKVVDSEEIVLRMFDTWAPRDLNFAGRFRYAARKAVQQAEKVYRPVQKGDEDQPTEKYRTSGLYEQLDKIGYDYGFGDQADIPLRCVSIGNMDSASVDGRIDLALQLHPTDRATRMLFDQARMCLKALGMHSKRVAYPATPLHVDIPFASLPSSVTDRQGDEFVSQMMEHAQDLRLRAGGVIAEPYLD